MGLSVIVVEWAPVEQMSRFFGAPEVGYQGGVLSSGIHGLNLDPQHAFREYMLSKVHLESVYDKLFENSIIRSFRCFIPGLDDLMCLGKVHELILEKGPRARRHKYDVIIFDGPPSAQAVVMLQTPSQAARIARTGPIEKHSRAIARLLEDPALTALCVVTQAEELAVAETEEIMSAAHENLNIRLGPVVANAVPSQVLTPKELKILNTMDSSHFSSNGNQTLESWIHYASLANREAEMAQLELARLRRKSSAPLLTVPFMMDGPRDIDRVKAIADYMLESE